MKTCPDCGRQYNEKKTTCYVCGAELVSGKESKAPSSGRFEKIAVLDNEVQAGLMDALLSDRKIPHIMQSYHDSALDGIFQTQKGWGVVLAPLAFREEIQAALEELRHPTGETTNQA